MGSERVSQRGLTLSDTQPPPPPPPEPPRYGHCYHCPKESAIRRSNGLLMCEGCYERFKR